MKLRDLLRLSLNSVSHRKLRSWLTLLGIIIGVAAIVSIVSIGEGAQQSVNSNLSRFGADIITINPGFGRAGFFGGNFRGGPGPEAGASTTAKEPTLGPMDAIIVKGNPNVLYVNETVSGGRADAVFVAETTKASVQGVNPATWQQVSSIELDSGRFLTTSDSSGIVLGYNIANKVFRTPVTIGRQMLVGEKQFTVVGILKSGYNDSTIFMPYASAWAVTDVNRNTFSSFQVKVRDASLVEQATQELTASLRISRKVTERNQDFSVTSSALIREQVSSALDSLTLFLGAIAAISLVVGAIGVANSMFTSVLEKTREVGIMKSLGATNSEIMMLFVIESALFGLIGGLAGALLGLAASLILSAAGAAGGGVTTLVTPELFTLAVLLSTVVGILAGIIPARMAAGLSPVEALRYE